MLLQVENLTKHFAGLAALSAVSFEVRESEILAIVGPNGAGKSVLFGLISGLLRATSGRIFLQDEEITGLKPHLRACKGIARTFQTTALFDQLRVVDNLALGYRLRTKSGFWATLFHSPGWNKDKTKTTERVEETLDFIGLTEKAFHSVSVLSQLDQRRLSIGMAIIGEPQIVLLDEPTGGLVLQETELITDLIRKIHQAYGITVCLIEHKMRMVMGLAERIIVLNFGRVIAEGTPMDIGGNPQVVEAYLGEKYVA